MIQESWSCIQQQFLGGFYSQDQVANNPLKRCKPVTLGELWKKCMTKRHWPLGILEDCALVGSLINHDHHFIQTKISALHRITMRPRILVNVREIDMTTILGQNKGVYAVLYMYVHIIYIYRKPADHWQMIEETCFSLCWIIEFLQSPYVCQWKSWPTPMVFRMLDTPLLLWYCSLIGLPLFACVVKRYDLFQEDPERSSCSAIVLHCYGFGKVGPPGEILKDFELFRWADSRPCKSIVQIPFEMVNVWAGNQGMINVIEIWNYCLGKPSWILGVFPTLGGHIDINLSKGHVITLVAAEPYKW